jgi:hypothetical protein
MREKPKFLQLAGYRLPTEAEWLHAFRAGTETGFSFGEADDIVDKYGWYNTNSHGKAQPVGLLKPNDLGLFDMQGNVFNWTGGTRDVQPSQGMALKNVTLRTYCGASFGSLPVPIRPMGSNFRPPTTYGGGLGFRTARTFDFPEEVRKRLEAFQVAQAAKADSLAAANKEIAAGRTREAVAYLVTASVADPDDTLLTIRVAALQAWFGLDSDLNDTCRRGLAFAGDTTDPEIAGRIAKICCLRPTSDKTRLDAALALARKGLAIEKSNSAYAWRPLTLGMAEYRNGHFAAADDAADDALSAAKANPLIAPTAAFYRAMSLFREGKPDEARKLAADTAAKMKPLPADEKNPLAGGANHDDLVLWLTYKEAKNLIHFESPPAAPVQPKKQMP